MSEERKKIVGVNLGNWLVLEKWMQPFLFEENCAEDEVWLNRKVPAKKLRPLMKKHRDTYIEETDFAKIAAHGINACACRFRISCSGTENHIPAASNMSIRRWTMRKSMG